MKARYEKVGIKKLCGLFGKSRLAWYDRRRREKVRLAEFGVVLEMVRLIRLEMEQAGTPMLYRILKPKFETLGIKMGRAALHALLLNHGLTIRSRKRKFPKTTWSQHWLKKWPNLIREIIPVRPMHVWVGDITYIRLANDDFCFLSLLTDAYSHLVVGWYLSPTLSHYGPLTALKMAVSRYPPREVEIYHHSDRGVQYCCGEYVELLQNHRFQISMTEQNEPYGNQIAERMNRTMKSYLGLGATFESFELALAATSDKIRVYNEVKPHSSCDYLTPVEAHQRNGPLKKWWKKGKRHD